MRLLEESLYRIGDNNMNSFSFEGARVKKVFDNKGGITLAISDTKAVSQPDGSFKSVFVCSRLVGTADAELLAFIRDNVSPDSVVNVSGFMSTRAGKKPGEWFDNLVLTSLALA
jgi:hypothetical protein